MGELRKVVCPYCGFGCNLPIDPKTLRVRPYRGEANRGKLCPKGLHATEFVTSKDRLKRPLKRVGSAMVLVSWGVAIEEIANRLLEIRELYGPDAVAFLASSKVSNEENYLLQKGPALKRTPTGIWRALTRYSSGVTTRPRPIRSSWTTSWGQREEGRR